MHMEEGTDHTHSVMRNWGDHWLNTLAIEEHRERLNLKMFEIMMVRLKLGDLNFVYVFHVCVKCFVP